MRNVECSMSNVEWRPAEARGSPSIQHSTFTIQHSRLSFQHHHSSRRRLPLDGYKGGWIEIIAGGMFSGKSEELIRRLRRAVIARQRVQVFKPLIDDRFSTEDIVSRDDRRLKAMAVA